jgi:membrane-associated protease RseP (regulator of RpoE activity)
MEVDVLYDLAAGFESFMNSGPGFPVSLLYLAVAGIPVVLLHELGHAIAARRLLGGEVKVSVGTAGELAELRLGQLAVTINALSHPGSPSGMAEFEASRATARDILLIALAGPVASLAGTVLTGWALSAVTGPGVVSDLLRAATMVGAFCVLNLVPLTLEGRGGGTWLRTDGRLALDALRVARATR